MFKLTYFSGESPGERQWSVDKVSLRGKTFVYLDDPASDYNIINHDGFFETEADAWREALMRTKKTMMIGIGEIMAKIVSSSDDILSIQGRVVDPVVVS